MVLLSYTFRITVETDKGLNPLKSTKAITTMVANKQSKVKKLLLMEEGGVDGIPLHYHGIIQTSWTGLQSIRTFITNLGKRKYKGNKEYSVKNKPIEKQKNPPFAYNYVCKTNKKYLSIGYSKEDIKGFADEFKKNRDDYERTKLDKITAVVELCKNLPKDDEWETRAIRVLLTEYKRRKLLPPVGYQLRKVLGRIMMEIDLEEYIRVVQLDYSPMGFYSSPHGSTKDTWKFCYKCNIYHDSLECCKII